MSERQIAVVGALKTVLHTFLVDPKFAAECTKIAISVKSHGFGSMLEQDDREFNGLLSHVKGCRSALEIGSRYGKSIQYIAGQMAPDTKVVSVDLPYTGGCEGLPDAEPILRATIEEIASRGHETHLFLGNSHNPALVKAVQDLGPYDFCFIDGDHSYAGVKADWENFGSHAKIVAFHDIINNPDCFRLWNEIKGNYRHVEYTQSVWLGIGVLFKDN